MSRLFVFLALVLAGLAVEAEVCQDPDASAALAVERGPAGFNLWIGEEAFAIDLPASFVPRQVRGEAQSVWIVGSMTTSAGQTISLWRWQEGALARVPLPSSAAPIQSWPNLFFEDDQLQAVAWLEGTSSYDLSVRSAERTVNGWATTERVSSPGPGTQTALRSTELRNGSRLLVWSAFDGEDDEIVWAERSGQTWSKPQPLVVGNRVPDIVPAVGRFGQSAVVAWSRFDGEDYRLQLALLKEGSWSLLPFAGPPGAAFPTVRQRADGVDFLFQAAIPQGWFLVQLSTSGVVERSGFVLSARQDRPRVAFGPQGSGDELELVWSGRLASQSPSRLRQSLDWSEPSKQLEAGERP